jgi:phage protein U
MALTKALIINTDELNGIPIPVMFNPPEYQLQRTNQYAEIGIPGLGSSLLQFVRGSAQTLTMELLFDTTGSIPKFKGKDVRLYTQTILKLLELNSKTGGPPRLLFLWGSLVFPCVLESVSQKFDYFNAYGLPLRATLNITLKGYEEFSGLLASLPSLAEEESKGYIVKSGDTLQSIAAKEMKDAKKWREIAEINALDDPRNLLVGNEITIPRQR